MTGGTVRRGPLAAIAAPAAVSIWSGWVGLGGMSGFGEVGPLPGISHLHLNTALTLPLGIESYAALALRAWRRPGTKGKARRFARWSALGAPMLGLIGQVSYHLLFARHAARAPSDDAHQALFQLLRAGRRLRMAGPDDPVFLSVSTKPRRLTPDGFRWRIAELGGRAGIPDLAPHQLRRSWTHCSLEAGVQERDLMHLSGWTTTKQLGRCGKAKARERAAAGKRFAVTAGVR